MSETENVDRTRPEGPWKFDGEVTRVFDDMLARSIPQLEIMREAVTNIADRFAQPGTFVVDLGCSRGDAMVELVERRGDELRYLGIETSEPMIAAARERFSSPHVSIKSLDLRRDFPTVHASVFLSILTLQFVPIEHRQRIVRRAFERLEPGGAMILVEKVLGSSSLIDELLVSTYWAKKAQNGYSSEDIERKALALEGVLVPVTAAWNEDLLRAGGFREVDCFWRWMNFAGWVAVK